MQDIKITLGGTEHTIKVLPMKKSREWRKKFEQPLGMIMGALSETGTVLSGADFSKSDDIAKIVAVVGSALFGTVGKSLIGSVDLVGDMLFDYSPELAERRDAIEATAYDDEVIAAFIEVLKAAYPFGSLLKALKLGPKETATSKN